MKEVWKTIKEYPNHEISNHGRVRSWIHRAAGGRRNKPLVMKIVLNIHNYCIASLNYKGKHSTPTIHRLVLESFVGTRPKGMEACHNNGIKTDNRLVNLRWDTHKNNQLDRVKHGTSNHGSRNVNSKLKEKDIPEIRSSIGKGVSLTRIAKSYRVTTSAICALKKGKTWSHIK